jgi:hypothetical protein
MLFFSPSGLLEFPKEFRYTKLVWIALEILSYVLDCYLSFCKLLVDVSLHNSTKLIIDSLPSPVGHARWNSIFVEEVVLIFLRGCGDATD